MGQNLAVNLSRRMMDILVQVPRPSNDPDLDEDWWFLYHYLHADVRADAPGLVWDVESLLNKDPKPK